MRNRKGDGRMDDLAFISKGRHEGYTVSIYLQLYSTVNDAPSYDEMTFRADCNRFSGLFWLIFGVFLDEVDRCSVSTGQVIRATGAISIIL